MKTLKYILSLALVFLVSCAEDDNDLGFVDKVVAPTNVSVDFRLIPDNSGLVKITPNAEGAASYNITSFGDGSDVSEVVMQGESAEHIYEEGVYTVSFVAVGITGLVSEEVTKELVVSFRAPENLEIKAEIDPANPFQVNVSATADYAAAFQVFFDASNVDEVATDLALGETVSFEYPLVGDYTIKVIALSGGVETTEVEVVISVTTPTKLPIDFEIFDTTVFFGFDGASGEVIDNPDTNGNSSAKVAKIVKGGPEVWAGNVIVASAPIDFSVKKLIKLNVWSPRAGGKLLFKLENLDDANIFIEKEVTLTGNSAWEEVTIDFSDIDTSQTYQKLVWFFDFGTAGDGSADWTFYVDNIKQDFAGVVVSQMLQDFEGTPPAFTDFGDIAPTEVITNPDASGINTSANVAQFTKSSGARFWGGTFFGLSEPLDLDTFKSISVKTWSPRTGVNVRLKIENSNNSDEFHEIDALTTVANSWEELEFDFTDAQPFNYDRIVIFFDFDPNNPGDGTVYYFDEIQLVATVLDFPLQDFEGVAPAFTDFGDIAPTEVIANPDASGINSSANVAQFTKSSGAQFWGGTFFGLAEPLDLDTFKSISVKTWSPRTGVNVRLKIENSNNSDEFHEIDALTTVANSWEELVFDFTDAQSFNYDRIVLFFDFDPNNPGDGTVYYFDEFKLTN
ncbi:hypothetical protein [uncultured Algibacter sp.]|uniref:hypothetical protein n=1 Tax=uncultured Algibacter sp. TaxID=298659 RepID=UPI00262C05F1|nr:hypothetical protein [uncultured Algibacter sp.]